MDGRGFASARLPRKAAPCSPWSSALPPCESKLNRNARASRGCPVRPKPASTYLQSPNRTVLGLRPQVALRASAAYLSSPRNPITSESTRTVLAAGNRKKEFLPQMHADPRRCSGAVGSFAATPRGSGDERSTRLRAYRLSCKISRRRRPAPNADCPAPAPPARGQSTSPPPPYRDAHRPPRHPHPDHAAPPRILHPTVSESDAPRKNPKENC